jgi:hypothetical protein
MKTMAAILFLSILAVACAFMFYSLLKFHEETRRPRRPVSRVRHDVIILRGSRERITRQAAARRRRSFTGEIMVQLDRADSGEATDVLPFGVRRLAVKRIARS